MFGPDLVLMVTSHLSPPTALLLLSSPGPAPAPASASSTLVLASSSSFFLLASCSRMKDLRSEDGEVTEEADAEAEAEAEEAGALMGANGERREWEKL